MASDDSTNHDGNAYRLSIDSGGTFTDCVLYRGNKFMTHFKIRSTPSEPEKAILSAIAKVSVKPISTIRHGTTVGTNTLLEKTGARVLFITNRGFESILELRRQNRPKLYALRPTKPTTLTEHLEVISVPWRRDVTGQRLGVRPSVNHWIDENLDAFERCDAVAICLLHACRFPEDERAIKTKIQDRFPTLSVSTSSELSAIDKEYERASTTVTNAYLQPIVSSYIAQIAQKVGGGGGLKIMTSSGGLRDSAEIEKAPIHTVLSGPAGGLIGARKAGLRNGFGTILTLDMGGTSTDIALVTGNPELTSDYMLDGMPILTPMLPIETIGAGGGSIAYVDDHGVLKVGPESVGADPGPACYGQQKARPRYLPTVTDAHVVLGRMDTLLGGELRIDIEDSTAAIAQLATQLNSTVLDTAQAIISTCTAMMARACRQVALARGVDPRKLTIVAFGGAGGLHACELADSLGCRKVLFPARAGVLSAEGIALASEYSVMDHLINDREADWSECTFSQLQMHRTSRTHSMQLLCRLRGQESTLALTFNEATSSESVRREFAYKFRQRFGFSPNQEQEIELVCLRVFEAQRPEQFDLNRDSVAVETPIEGPIVHTYGATLFIPPHWSAHSRGEDILCCVEQAFSPLIEVDTVPLGLEVHQHKLMSIAEEMGYVLKDSALSTNIRERRDYSCAIFDGQGRMLAHAAHIPVHLGASTLSIASVLSHCELSPNEDYLLNNPFKGGTHLPDLTVVRPVFFDSSTPRYFVVNRAHHSDVGGVTPGSLPVATRTSFSEGLSIADEGFCFGPAPITPAVQEALCRASRLPKERSIDLAAQIAANDRAEARLIELMRGSDPTALVRFDTALLDYSGNACLKWLRSQSDFSVTAEEFLEGDGLTEKPIKIALRLTKEKDRLIFDFCESDESTKSSLNAVLAITRAAVFYAIKLLLPSALANDGIMRHISILTLPGTIVDARAPSAVSSGNVETSQRIVDVILSAFEAAIPNSMPAQSCGSMNNVLLGGMDHRSGSSEAFVHYETLGGGSGAGPWGAGTDGIHVHMTNTLNTPIEVFERRFPIRIDRYTLTAKAETSRSKFPGGRGIERHYFFVADTTVTVIAERHRIAPRGILGGQDGTSGYVYLKDEKGAKIPLSSKFTRHFKSGETLVIGTAGGGCWGSAEAMNESVGL